jgi:hypothetical protein
MQALDISEKIMKVLRKEYQNELALPKSKKSANSDTLPISLGFSDITVWFYKRQCEQALQDAKAIWEKLPDNPLQRQDLSDFLRLYTDEIISKFTKFTHYNSKADYHEDLIHQTNNLLLSISHFQPRSPPQDSITLDIVIDSIENHDLSSVFGDPDLVGHHLEISVKDQIIGTNIEGTNGSKIDFKKTRMTMSLPLGCKGVVVSLYEDYIMNGVASQKLVGR